MLTPYTIEEQVQLERDQIAQGLKRLRDQSIKLEEQDYASATIYGITGVDTLLPLLVKRINDTSLRIHRGKNGVAFRDIHQYLKGIDAEVAAAIACKLTFDKAFSFKEGSNVATNVCDSIGQAIENECQMRHYESNAPGLLHVLKKNYWHRSIGTNQKLVVIRTLMNRYDVKPWTPWLRSNRIKLGGWLLDCIIETSNWFYTLPIRTGRKTTIHVVPTPEFMDIKDEIMANAEMFSPLAWPMLIPPNDWTNEKPGGYILNEVMRGHDLVRRVDHHRIQGETPLTFLNQIQKVSYKLNQFTVTVAEKLQEKGIAVGKFLPIVQYDLPPKPPDIDTYKEAR